MHMGITTHSLVIIIYKTYTYAICTTFTLRFRKILMSKYDIALAVKYPYDSVCTAIFTICIQIFLHPIIIILLFMEISPYATNVLALTNGDYRST